MVDIDAKLFIDEFFNIELNEIVKENFKQYDIMQNAKNEVFLRNVFTNPPSILPI